MNRPVPGTCLVHLVWAPLGPEPLRRFLAAYDSHQAGSAHRLLVLFNGFAASDDADPWRELLAGVEHEELTLECPLLDLAAYAEAIRRVPAERYCFLNSYSAPLIAGWLEMLERALEPPQVGLVGASGSWASVSSHLRFALGLGGAYADVFGDRRATVAALAAAGARDDDAPAAEHRREPLAYARAVLGQMYGFPAFPVPHLRTNGFMIEGSLARRLSMRGLDRKMQVYRLESGRRSITAQANALGLAALVVGRDGRAYPSEQWPASRTFWQGDQENLLIADNRTEDYERGERSVREALARFAWGHEAATTPHAAATLRG